MNKVVTIFDVLMASALVAVALYLFGAIPDVALTAFCVAVAVVSATMLIAVVVREHRRGLS